MNLELKLLKVKQKNLFWEVKKASLKEDLTKLKESTDKYIYPMRFTKQNKYKELLR